MRYSIDHCVFGFNATDVGSNPCQTSTACGALEKVLLAGDLDPKATGDYAFCDADDGTSLVSDDYNKCLACIRAGSDHRYLTNCKPSSTHSFPMMDSHLDRLNSPRGSLPAKTDTRQHCVPKRHRVRRHPNSAGRPQPDR